MYNPFRKKKFVPLEILPVSASQFTQSPEAWKVQNLYRNGKSGIESAQLLADLYLESQTGYPSVDHDLLVLFYFNYLTEGKYSLS